MDGQTHNTTRRGMLSAIASVPVVAAFGTIALPAMGTSNWSGVRNAYVVAREMASADSRSHQPCHEAWVAAGRRQDMRAQFGIDAHLKRNDALCDVSAAAFDSIIAYECRTMAELADKVGMIDDTLSDIDSEVWRHVLADIRRLAVEGR